MVEEEDCLSTNNKMSFFLILLGILEREQEQSVVYGSIDFGKTVVSNEKYIELVSNALYILVNVLLLFVWLIVKGKIASPCVTLGLSWDNVLYTQTYQPFVGQKGET